MRRSRYAQLMLSESHQPNVVGGYHELCGSGMDLNLSATAGKCFTDWMAAVSDDGKTLVVRTENPNNATVSFSASIHGGPWSTTVAVRTLAGDSLDAVRPQAIQKSTIALSFLRWIA